MIVGHPAGIFATREEFAAFTAWLRDREGWEVRDGIPPHVHRDGLYVFETTPEQQRRICEEPESWLKVLAE